MLVGIRITSILGKGTAAAAILAVVLAVAPAGAGAGLKDRPVQPNVLKRQLTNQLHSRDLDVRRILPCRPQQSERVYRCEWRATGTYTGGPGYQCGGYASYTVASKSWRIDRCLNVDLWNLLREKGLEPKAILNAERVDGGVKYEWRAEGVAPGEVPYRCKNVALYSHGEWRIGACDNEIEAAEPLAANLGPVPVFGFNDDWTQPSVLSQLSKATAIGATTARFNLSWAAIESKRGTYTWGAYDQIINTMLSKGVHPLLVIATAPCWAQAGSCSAVGAPSAGAVGDYAKFVAAAAQRYPGALGIEIWNEPNWTAYWQPAPDPARYSDMVRQSAAAVHAAGSNVPVIVAGDAPLANTSADDTKIAFDEFLREVYQAGGIGQADAVAHHLYFGPVDDYVLNMRQQIARLRGVMQANGDGGMPIWITELGISSSEETDLNGQGLLLAQLFTTLRRIPNIPVVIVHRLMDAHDSVSGGSDDRGVLDSSGNRKPAYCVLGQATGVVPANC